LPLFADESCQVEERRAAVRRPFHGVNIKLCKCGGLTPARRMISEARKLGLKVMVGCMTESTVGCSAIAQLAPLSTTSTWTASSSSPATSPPASPSTTAGRFFPTTTARARACCLETSGEK
jgi:L-alanine-DL-glutamate epimerase-like enolase superfamily enzyme